MNETVNTNIHDCSRPHSPSGRSILDGMQRVASALSTPLRGAFEALTHGVKMLRDCGCSDKSTGDDCHCRCSVCDADLVAYVRCGETRIIPVTFENDTRRAKEVTLELSAFRATSNASASVVATPSKTNFTLAPCGAETIWIGVNVDCQAEKSQTAQRDLEQLSDTAGCQVL
jgi:hypothetical protein